MPDLSAGWNSDLQLGVTGDLVTVDGSALGTQRVIRRLLTAPTALLFHPDYGAGLPQKVGDAVPLRSLTGLVRAQMFKEAAVAQNPAPQVSLGGPLVAAGTVAIAIRYHDRNSGAPQLLDFDLSAVG
jgi:hypothetical protein